MLKKSCVARKAQNSPVYGWPSTGMHGAVMTFEWKITGGRSIASYETGLNLYYEEVVN